MAIDFKKTFGESSNGAPNTGTNTDRPKAQVWINIGYDSGVADSEGKSRFVSLPLGIPVDQQERLPTNGRNKEFAAFQAARNNLMDQILEVAGALQPGEEILLNLQVQLRRVNDEAPEPSIENNPFAKTLALVGQ